MTASALRDCELLMVTALRASSLPSVLGGLAVLASFARIPKIRNHSFLLLLGIVACDSVMSIGFFFPVPEDRTWQCRLQGWWMQFFPVTSVFISLLMSVHMYLLIARAKARHLTKRFLNKAAGLLVFISFLASLVPFITDQYGLLDGGHCWIVLDEDGRSKSVGFAMRWGLAYGPVWTICAICCALYYKIFHYTRSLFLSNRILTARSTTVTVTTSPSATGGSRTSCRVSGGGEDKVMKAVLLLRWYPVIMLCSWGGLIIKRLYQFYSHDVPCWAYVLGLAVLNLQGYWNSMIFLANNIVWQSWYHILGWKVHDPSHGWLAQVQNSFALQFRKSSLLDATATRSESHSLANATSEDPDRSPDPVL